MAVEVLLQKGWIIKLCLMLWGRSPQAYDDLGQSGFLILPSSRLLRYYKNAIQQKAGIQRDVFLWMRKEADKLNLTQMTREGGLILDEMAIQEDVYIQNDGKLSGLTDLGEASQAVGILRRGKSQVSVASHVLQLVFLGNTGFRFLFSHYPSRECTAVELFSIIWENIACLRDYGFRVNFISMDGASTNRTLMRVHFAGSSMENLRQKMFEVPNPMPPNNTIIFIMDPSHCFKKIRNNLLKSGEGKTYKRYLHIGGRPLHWKWWIAAYNWDRSTNSLRIHHRLTQEHLFPDSAQKMRNHLAEEVLNEDMLYLVQCYQRALSQEEARKFDVVVEFLSNTSTFIKIFCDLRPVHESNDERLSHLNAVHSWFLNWETEILCKISLLPKERANLKKRLMSDQTREDISSAILGFTKLCQNTTEKLIPGSIVPGRVNTDIVENIFCQQRGVHHGNTTNPNYSSYCSGVNAILLGQPSMSKKKRSNSGLPAVDPASCTLNRSLNRKKSALPRI